MLEVDAGGIAVEVEPPCQWFVCFVATWWTAAEEQPGKMASDMEVNKKQRCVTEFLYAEKIFIDACWT
jgi:hypothetical protein